MNFGKFDTIIYVQFMKGFQLFWTKYIMWRLFQTNFDAMEWNLRKFLNGWKMHTIDRLQPYVFWQIWTNNKCIFYEETWIILDKIHHMEAFSNNFWCHGVKFKGIYERSKNAHDCKTITLRILTNFAQY